MLVGGEQHGRGATRSPGGGSRGSCAALNPESGSRKEGQLATTTEAARRQYPSVVWMTQDATDVRFADELFDLLTQAMELGVDSSQLGAMRIVSGDGCCTRRRGGRRARASWVKHLRHSLRFGGGPGTEPPPAICASQAPRRSGK